MAGFLAPQIDDIRIPRDDSRPAPADTSVGSALSGIAGLINLVGKGTGGTTETQQGRNDRILRPIFKDFKTLLAQRDSGHLPSSAFKTKWTVLMSGAIAANPTLRAIIVDGFSTLAGEQIGAVEETVADTQRDARNLYLKTPIGQVLAVRAVDAATDDDGNLNTELLELAVNVLYGEDVAKRAKAAQVTEEVRVAKETNEYNNIKEARWIGPLLKEQSQMAADVIKANIALFIKTPGTSSDAVTAVAALAGITAQLISNFTADAAERGILDESDYKAGLALIEKQLDGQISYLQLIADSEAAQLTIKRNKETSALIDVLVKGGVPGTEPFMQAFAVFVMENNLVDMASLALAMKESAIKSRTLSPNASDPGTPSVYTDAFTIEATNLDEELQIQDVKIGLAWWKGGQNFSPEVLKNEDQRLGLVTGLGRALGVMNVTANPIDEITFDRVYDPAFINLYRSITKFDDETARILEKIVRTHLGATLDKRRTFTKTNIQNRLGSSFPGVTMKFDGDKFVIDYGTGRGKTVSQTTLFDALDRNSLPRTSEGVASLLDGTRQLNKDETRAVQVVQGVASDEIAYLNKIIGTINMFPEFSETTLPPVSEFKEEGAESVAPLIEVDKEYDGLPVGAGYRWIDPETGEEFFDIKGEER